MFVLLPLFVLSVGVAQAKHVGYHGNAFNRRPITTSQQQRICADLCISGLGGDPCGDVCFDLMPKSIPYQSVNESGDVQTAVKPSTENDVKNIVQIGGNNVKPARENDKTAVNIATKEVKTVVKARSDVCPLLCSQHLGYPLCQCTEIGTEYKRKFKVDFHAICDFYCEKHNWLLKGCPVGPACKQNGDQNQDGGLAKPKMMTYQVTNYEIDWDKWCHIQCANSNGGSACNCDILPFALK